MLYFLNNGAGMAEPLAIAVIMLNSTLRLGCHSFCFVYADYFFCTLLYSF
jgi:hypothetical protein